MKAHSETEILNFTWAERKNPLLGLMKTRAKITEIREIDSREEYLKEGWSEGLVIYSEEVNEKDEWSAWNVSSPSLSLFCFVAGGVFGEKGERADGAWNLGLGIHDD